VRASFHIWNEADADVPDYIDPLLLEPMRRRVVCGGHPSKRGWASPSSPRKEGIERHTKASCAARSDIGARDVTQIAPLPVSSRTEAMSARLCAKLPAKTGQPTWNLHLDE
jgi:hypothetical protein